MLIDQSFIDNYVKLILSVDRIASVRNGKEYRDAITLLELSVRASKQDLNRLKKDLEECHQNQPKT